MVPWLLLLAALSPAFATDTFPGTTISGVSGSFTASNTTAGGETGEPATFGGGNLNTIWYSWTAPATGTLTVQTCSSTQTTFDTTLKAYTGAAVGSLTTVAANDDACANTTVNAYASLITVAAVSGTTYRIQVDGYGSDLGNYLFAYSFVPPTVTIANTTNGAEPSTNGVMTVTQSAISASNTVIAYSVGGAATSGSDYTALSGTVTIPAGSTSAVISIPVINDTFVEGGETVIVTLTSVTSGVATLGGAVAATNTITSDDVRNVNLANTTNGSETGPANGVMTATLTSTSASSTVVSYTVSGTATSGADFTALSGSFTIPASTLSTIISIPVLNDLIVEGNETVIVTLTAVTSGAASLGPAVIATNTIADNDSATVSIANTSNGAEAGPVNGVMTVTQTAASSQNTVIAYTVSGTAASGSDYTALSGSVTVTAGATAATIPIPVLNDAIVEGGETVIVTLNSITSGLASLGTPVAATSTIADNDSATVSIANTSNGAEAGPVNGVMTVTQTAASSQNTVIVYTVSGTAASGSDFTALSGSVTVAAGATSAVITVSIIDDLIVDPGETIIITLTSVSSGLAALGSPLAATNTVADNDVASFAITKAVDRANITSAVPLNYTITIDNTGNVPLTGLSITDTLLLGASPRTLTSGPSYASGDADSDGEIDASETWTYAAAYAVSQSDFDNGGTFSNTATFDAAETAPAASGAAVTAVTHAPELSLSKTAAASGPLTAGQIVNYTYTVTNTGNVTVSSVDVNETAFNGHGTPVPSPLPTGPTTLAPGDSVVFTASYTVTQDDIDLLQ